MNNIKKLFKHGKAIMVLLMLAVILFPLLVVQIIQTDNPEPYVFEARIVKKLDETLNGKLQYFLAQHIKGVSPAMEFVVTVDRAYTRGRLEARFEANRELWMQGSLMTREVYYGDQYLFFDYTQLYISQVRGEIFWPDQMTELGILYLSPVTGIFSLVSVWFYPFTEEYSLKGLLVLILKSVSVAITSIFLIRNLNEKRNQMIIFLNYVLLSMIFTVPILTELY